VDWLALLMDDQLTSESLIIALVPGGVSLLLEEGLDDADITRLGLDLIEAAGGRPWYISLRLIGVIKDNWGVLGAEILLRGVDATRLSLSAWLDVALLLTIRNMDPKDITMFTAQLEMVPPEEIQAGVEPQEMEMSRDQFLSMMG
jgi:hypothetical protein